jgi:geranylgeranyl diphosphate synthase type I
MPVTTLTKLFPQPSQAATPQTPSLGELRGLVEHELGLLRIDLSSSLAEDLGAPELVEPLTTYGAAGGKRLRPLLMLTSYLGWAPRVERPVARAAAAMELLHWFALIHDDIADNAERRHGVAALQHRYTRQPGDEAAARGKAMAMVAGDLLFAFAVGAFADACEKNDAGRRALHRLMQAAFKTGQGELQELARAGSSFATVREEVLWRTYDLKTGYYSFEAPLAVGAILSGAPAEGVDRLALAGLQLGRAYQLLDDLDDLLQESERGEKPAYADLSAGVITIPLLRLYRRCTQPEQREHLQRMLGAAQSTVADYTALRGWLYAYDIPGEIARDVARLRAGAMQMAARSGCGERVLGLLETIAQGLLSR